MKKLLVSLIAAAALASPLLADGFEKKTVYVDGTFTDVPAEEWYAPEVKSSYELGFMKGSAATLFTPNGNVTVAEAITMASRVHASYAGKTIADPGEPWYQVYVDYAVSEGIMKADDFDDFDRNITRAEMAVLFGRTAPASWFTPINDVKEIPDVNYAADCRDALLSLYNAGIVMGSDAYGTFNPDSDILRCEAAAIINRIALPENRLHKTLETREKMLPALWYIDDNGGMNPTQYGSYGWEFDPRGVPAGSAQSLIRVIDTSETEGTSMIRTFMDVTEGRLVMETNITFTSAENGFEYVLGDGVDGKQVMSFITKDGKFFAKDGGKYVDTGFKFPKTMMLRTVTDFAAKTNEIYADGVKVASFGFSDADAKVVNNLIFRSDKENKVVVTVDKTKLFSGYAINDIFMANGTRTLGDNYTHEGDGKLDVEKVVSGSYDQYSAVLESKAGSTDVIAASFPAISRKVCFEMKFYMENYNDGFTIALTNGGEDVAKVETKGNAFIAEGETLRTYNSKVWQTVRFEVNFDNGKVEYSIDHKKLGKGFTYAASADGIRITLPSAADSKLIFDDIAVYNLFDEEPSYVPAPKAAPSDDYIIGMEVCDIWRNGFQFGWDYTSAFDELNTYLGKFDEGSTEVADWETKWLIEHGVDFKLPCWYNGTPSAPLKTPRNNFGLAAQLDSKYTDMMPYAIMWEDAGNVPNFDGFVNYTLPYWAEYYLYDRDRYFSIDNKALITIYKLDSLNTAFGSNEKIREATDLIRKTCVDLGYDGAIILTYGSTAGSPDAFVEMGIDGIMAYNWGQNGKDPTYQINALTKQDASCKTAETGFTAVPTVGVGFSNMYLGQGNHRSDNITNTDFETVLTWVRDDLLAKRTGETWQTKMLMLSNWDEFGEGHYIMPTDRNGFGYLDVLRDVFGDGAEHTDHRPDEAQKARFTALYNNNFSRVRIMELLGPKTYDISTMEPAKVYDFSSGDETGFLVNFGTTVEYKDGTICGVSNGADFSIHSRGMELDASEVKYLHVRERATAASENETLQIYFLTSEDKTWDEKKALNCNIKADGEFHDYVVDLSTCARWKGTIIDVRLDPIGRGDSNWAFSIIEFLKGDKSYELFVNTETAPTPIMNGPFLIDGNIVAAIDPYASSFYQKLGLFYRWDAKAGKFTVYGPEDSFIEYTMGSATAKTSKGDMILAESASLYDGIPCIDISVLADVCHLLIEEDSDKYTIYHHDIIPGTESASLDIEWTFDVPGYIDGFTTACLEEIEGVDGIAYFHSTSNGRRHDPVFNSPTINIDANKYEKIIVGFTYDLDNGAEQANSITSSMFYHGPGGAFNGDDVVQVTTKGFSSDGKTIEVEFDMSSKPTWFSTITQIRFDPFEAEGIVGLDYIKIILTNPEGKTKASRPTEAELMAGEEYPKGITVSASNGKISVVPNPDDESEMVYLVQTTASGRNWTYMNIFMNFEAGATYDVAYDICPLPDFNGKEYGTNSIGGNFIYGDDGKTVANHTQNVSTSMASDAGWKHVTGTVTIPSTYLPTPLDCFQFWSNPANNVGTSYMVKDISIIKK